MLAPIKRPINLQTTVSRNRVVVDITTELISRGHQITLIGTKDSLVPGASIVGVVPTGLNYLPKVENPFYQQTAYLTMMVETLLEMQSGFDLVHNHMYPEFLPYLSVGSLKIPMLTTVHAQMTDELRAVLSRFPDSHLVAISEAAKRAAGLPMTVVHNSVDTDFFLPNGSPKEYFLSVGRMSAARDKDGKFIDPKGIGTAIAIAQKANIRLKIVGNVEDPKFFETIVAPNLSDKIEFVGEVSPEQKMTRDEMRDIFAGAIAFLNPINWEEPFGLVMAESLSCSTPVVAFNRGSVSEILVDGKTGFIIDPISGIDGFISAIGKIDQIDRKYCRDHAVAHFSKKRMADDYERLYFKLLEKPQ